jgi:tRNA-dihydrouridine synthase A
MTFASPQEWRFCVAPMIDWTDRHCRFFHRLLTRRARLYTEMVTAPAIRHGDPRRLLAFSGAEQPVAVQLGGSDPAELAEAARIAEGFGYVEVNLNVGCPSDRVQSGRFGACLMAEPLLVARCVAAMKAAVSVPVTVKCRLGIDDQDIEASLDAFVAAVRDAGADLVIVHARKAWLHGLSPKENREIPPLDYGRVHRLKQAFPGLPIVINGGIGSLDEALVQLAHVDGVMLGRAAYQRPGLLAEVDGRLFGEADPQSDPVTAVEAYAEYAAAMHAGGVPLHHLTRPLLGLFHGAPGARLWRRMLSVDAQRPGASTRLLHEALSMVTAAARSDAA